MTRPQLTLYTRPGCHLCEEMKATLARLARQLPVDLVEVDITGDPALERRYGEQVPVLLVDGQPVARFRVNEDALRRVLGEGRGTGGRDQDAAPEAAGSHRRRRGDGGADQGPVTSR